jgi:hypothetical protein
MNAGWWFVGTQTKASEIQTTKVGLYMKTGQEHIHAYFIPFPQFASNKPYICP